MIEIFNDSIIFLKLFGWLDFYGISALVGYLMPNPAYKYIKYLNYKQTVCR